MNAFIPCCYLLVHNITIGATILQLCISNPINQNVSPNLAIGKDYSRPKLFNKEPDT